MAKQDELHQQAMMGYSSAADEFEKKILTQSRYNVSSSDDDSSFDGSTFMGRDLSNSKKTSDKNLQQSTMSQFNTSNNSSMMTRLTASPFL